MHTLENAAFRLDCYEENAFFHLTPQGWAHPLLQGARMSVIYRQNGRRYEALAESWSPVESETSQAWSPQHGSQQILEIGTRPDAQGVHFRLAFALPRQHDLFLWKITVCCGGAPVTLERVTLLEAGERLNGGRVRLPAIGAPRPAWYAHGWQSWNWSAAYASDQPARRTRLGLLEAPMYICDGTPQPATAGHYSSDFFGALVDRSARVGFLAGFLSQKQHFGSLEAWTDDRLALRIWANGDGMRIETGAQVETDWAAIQMLDLDSPQPMDTFLDAAARENEVTPPGSAPAGWCSWYYYYQNVTATAVRQNLAALDGLRERLPLQLVQIDDGFERQIGDWFEAHPRFPQGVAPLAAEIREKQFTPGLWLAPFIVHPGSHLARQHPDWLLRNRRGGLVRSGFNWNALTVALDLTVPEALDYACSVVDRAAHEWGYTYLKLDFLYAGGLAGRYRDPHCSRAQVLRRGLEGLRAAAGPETTLLGCGVPIGSALGLFEAMRIGADVAGDWRPRYLGTNLFFGAEPHMPSLRNAIQNTLTRAPMHARWWINDPDCLLVRADTRLTLPEVQSLATAIGVSGGSLLLSDDLPALPPERLRIAEVLLPVLGLRPRVLDLFDRETPARLRLDLEGATGSWSLLALFNWEDEARELQLAHADFDLPDGEYLLHSFWDGRVLRLEPGGGLELGEIPAHGCVLLAARLLATGPQYLGSDLHFSQGKEVDWWEAGESRLLLKGNLPHARSGYVTLRLPAPPRFVFVDGAESPAKKVAVGLYRIAVHGDSEIGIEFSR